MSHLTQKQVIELHKEKRVSVFSFDRETGLRYGTYDGLTPTHALSHAMNQIAAGYDVLFVDYKKHGSESIRMEFKTKKEHGRRVNYEEIKAISMDRLF